jgi:exosortase H (IPTLxxWG-CTERM-specific)
MLPRLKIGLARFLDREVLRGWLLFVLYAVGSFALLYGLDDEVVIPFTRGIAVLTAWLLGRLGVAAVSSGTIVGTQSFQVAIHNNCNAIYETALFTAAVLAYPATWRERAWGAALGVVTLYLVNLVRVLSLIYVGSNFRRYFDASHIYIWQSLFIAFTLGLWLYWAGTLVRRPRH